MVPKNEEDVDEYTSEGIFFVPETARWSAIASQAHTAEIGTVIDDAMRAIEKENKSVFPTIQTTQRPDKVAKALSFNRDCCEVFLKYKVS